MAEKKVSQVLEEKIPKRLPDRRILHFAPDPKNRRKIFDRRAASHIQSQHLDRFSNLVYDFGSRYDVDIPISLRISRKTKISALIQDISSTGALIKVEKKYKDLLPIGTKLKLRFKIPKGRIHEDYEHRVNLNAHAVRYKEVTDKKYIYIGFEFDQAMNKYFKKTRWAEEISTASLFLVIVLGLIAFLRIDSVVYFRHMPLLYGYSIFATVYLITRYLFGSFYRNIPIDPAFTPGVSVVIPCFNEEKWIEKTIISCLDQDYPLEQLEVVVVDDCSTDNSRAEIKRVVKMLEDNCSEFDIKNRVKCVFLDENHGKRGALAQGLKVVSHDLVSFVDSDSFMEPSAVRNLVQPFRDEQVGGVTGRTDVANAMTNYLTKMQSVRYYIAFRIMKAAEGVFDAVSCLSGPISCYRRDLLEKYADDWVNQKFLGFKATFGDDRSMTNFILKEHRTFYQDSAICKTIVPSKLRTFLKQQMRWKRSWLRESTRGATFMWKKEPFHALSYYGGFIVPLLAPFVVTYNMFYIPITRELLPLVFVSGILLMSFLMSFIYLILRRSNIWIYGLWFVLFYEFVLMWQMPIAIITFWKSTWGTRETKDDVEERKKREAQKQHKRLKKQKIATSDVE